MRTLFFLFLVFICFKSSAQEKLMQVLPTEKDSAQVELEKQILYRQLLSGTIQNDALIPDLKIPEFDINKAIAQLHYNFDTKNLFNPGKIETQTFSSFGFYPSPFLRNGAIFNSDIYELNDKLKLGGYSFGANSIFSAPFPNQGMNNFDTRGASMFMQYKVSKKFKIETRVSVTQGNSPEF